MSVSEGNGDRSLRPIEESQSLGVPFAAMADALRANAEAIQRIDASQRKIADSIEKGDRAGQVITSTRALNETFRGLSEIQRGLLDAVVKDRGRGRGLPFAFAAIAILAALLGFLLYERWTSTDSVPRAVYDQARATAEDRALQLSELRAAAQGSGSEAAALKRSLADRDRDLSAAERKIESLGRRESELERDLDSQQARLKNFLAVKDIADRVGAVEVRNAALENENRALRDRVERAEKERERLLILMGERKLDENVLDPAAIRKALEEKGVIPKAEPEAGTKVLLASTRRRIRKELNKLLAQAPGEETYEVLSFAGLEGDGTRLTDVKIGHYRNAGLLNSLHCKELEVFIDPARDTAELRCRKGYFAITRQPLKQIPFDEDGHSVFLRKIGLKNWMDRSLVPLEMARDGRLTWKTGPGSR